MKIAIRHEPNRTKTAIKYVHLTFITKKNIQKYSGKKGTRNYIIWHSLPTLDDKQMKLRCRRVNNNTKQQRKLRFSFVFVSINMQMMEESATDRVTGDTFQI